MLASSPTPPSVDVAILGGGPAGTAAGLTLLKRDDLSVAVLEASDYTSFRIGESLTPGARPLLEYLDVWDRFQDEQPRTSFGSRAAWGSESVQALDYLFTLHGTGWSLDRVRFDRMLADVFRERGGYVFANTRFRRAQQTPDGGWRLALSKGRTLNARYLIDATGRNGHFARQQDVPRVMHDRLTGVGTVGALPDDVEPEAAVLVEACAYGWWYTAPVPNRGMIAVLVSDGDLIAEQNRADPDRWAALLADTTYTRERVAEAHFPDAPRGFPCHSSHLARVGGPGWVAVGDAAASHDPLSSSGIPHALGGGVHGALVAADALFADGDLLDVYQTGVLQDFSHYRTTHWQYYRREARWPGAPFWKRRRTPVSLSPTAVVTTVGPVADDVRPVHLSSQQAERLYEVCTPGLETHRIVRTFAERHPDVPDQRIILGLQELVDHGRVETASHATPETNSPVLE